MRTVVVEATTSDDTTWSRRVTLTRLILANLWITRPEHIAVLVPELVVKRWWAAPVHSQRVQLPTLRCCVQEISRLCFGHPGWLMLGYMTGTLSRNTVIHHSAKSFYTNTPSSWLSSLRRILAICCASRSSPRAYSLENGIIGSYESTCRTGLNASLRQLLQNRRVAHRAIVSQVDLRTARPRFGNAASAENK